MGGEVFTSEAGRGASPAEAQGLCPSRTVLLGCGGRT